MDGISRIPSVFDEERAFFTVFVPSWRLRPMAESNMARRIERGAPAG